MNLSKIVGCISLYQGGFMFPHNPHSRKHPAHGVKDIQNQSTIVAVTTCTRDRIAWLADDDIHALLKSVWTGATGWLVGRYMIMPDHIHYFVAPGTMDISLERWAKYWKTQFSLRHLCPGHDWLTDHWDTRVRSASDYTAKWEYIRQNPERKGLVLHSDDWPYQGVIHDLMWYG